MKHRAFIMLFAGILTLASYGVVRAEGMFKTFPV